MGKMVADYLRQPIGSSTREDYNKAILYCLGYDDGNIGNPHRVAQADFDDYRLGYNDGFGDKVNDLS